MPKTAAKRRKAAIKTKHNHLRHLHVLRLSCFGFLALGLMAIQVVEHVHTQTVAASHREVLAYATNVSITDLLASTNQSRAANGLGALSLNSKLNSGAQSKANDMIAKNYWSHVAPDGTQPWAFFTAAGYQYSRAGENLAYGFDNSAQTEDAWMNSSGHRANVLGDYTEVGFGIANGDNYQGGPNTVVAAFYGKPTAAPAPAPKPAPSSTTTQKPAAQQPVAAVPTPQPEPQVEQPKPDPLKVTAAVKLPEPKKVTNFESLIGGQANWALYASVSVVGLSSLGFAGTHWQLVRRGWKTSRHFILVHPAVDTAVVAAIGAVILTSAAGFIK
jgi:uncharacterized protein YkwD